MNIKKDRLEIAKIIKNNLSLMNNNNFMCQEVADAIIVYLIENNISHLNNTTKKAKELLHELEEKN